MNRSVVLALLAVLFGCGPTKAAGPMGIGERKVEGGGQALAVVPHTAAVLYLHEPTHPVGKLMPPDAYLGELHLVGADGADHVLGQEVSNLTGELAFSPDGKKVAFLNHFNFETHLGDLSVADAATGAVIPVAKEVSYFGYRGDAAAGGLFGVEALAYVTGGDGELHVDGQSIDKGVATFEFVRGGNLVLYRQRSTIGGDLRVHGRLAGAPVHKVVGEHVAEYQIAADASAVAYSVMSKDGTFELHVSTWGTVDRKLGEQCSSFRLSPDGHSVTYVIGPDPQQGDLYVEKLEPPAPPLKLGKKANAGTYRYASDGRLAYITDYYEPTRSGKLALWDFGRGSTPVADSARVFGFSPSGRYLGYLKRIIKPLYTEHLMLMALGSPGSTPSEPKLIGDAIYAFDFTPDERRLLYKTECTRGGESCELFTVACDAPSAPLIDGGVQKNPAAKKLVSGVDDYDFSPDGKWLWITFKNAFGNNVDLAVIPTTDEMTLPRYIDWKVEPGPRWTSADKVVYLVNAPKRAGLYEADPALAQPLKLNRR